MTEEERNDKATIMAQKLAMAYITGSIANGYLEDSFELMRSLGVMLHDVKQKANLTTDYFDKFNHNINWFFRLGDKGAFGKDLCEDYSVLQEACDQYMLSGIRLSAYKAWNSDEWRQEARYLCRVEGARDTDIMLLEWRNRQWLMYVNSTVAAGWLTLTPGIKVVEVVKRINKGDTDPMRKEEANQ